MNRLFVVVFLSFTSACWAQLEAPLDKRPIGSVYARNYSQSRYVAYLKRIVTEFDLRGEIFSQLENYQFKQDDGYVVGSTLFLRLGLPPRQEWMTFFMADSIEEAQKTLRTEMESAEDATGSVERNIRFVNTDTAGSFQQKMTISQNLPVPEGMSPEDYLKQLESSVGSNADRTIELAEANGQSVVRLNNQLTTQFRFHDGVVFQAQTEDLLTMDLPKLSDVVGQLSDGHDAGIEAHFDRIPVAIRQLGWNLLSATVGTQMQQRDDEPEQRSDFRRASYSTGLDIVKAVMFEVTKAYGWLNFANEDQPFVQAQLSFETKPKSSLRQQLEDLSSARSRFSPLVNQNSAVTFHTCFRITESAAKVLQTGADRLLFERSQPQFPQSLNDTAGTLANVLQQLADSRNLEMLLKVDYDTATDGVIYGGIRTGNNADLLKGLVDLLVQIEYPEINMAELVRLTTINEQDVVELILPDRLTDSIQEIVGLQLKRVYFTNRADCLWFAIGSENAVNIFQRACSECEQNGGGRTPLASFHADTNRWLAYPTDEPTGIANCLRWLDENVAAFPPGLEFVLFSNLTRKPTPLIDKAIKYGGNQDVSIQLITDRNGALLKLKIGEALIHYWVARMIALQEQAMSR